MMNLTEQERHNWILLYLYARGYRIDNDYQYIRVYNGGECVLNRELGTDDVKLFVEKIEYDDLKAIMEVI